MKMIFTDELRSYRLQQAWCCKVCYFCGLSGQANQGSGKGHAQQPPPCPCSHCLARDACSHDKGKQQVRPPPHPHPPPPFYVQFYSACCLPGGGVHSVLSTASRRDNATTVISTINSSSDNAKTGGNDLKRFDAPPSLLPSRFPFHHIPYYSSSIEFCVSFSYVSSLF